MEVISKMAQQSVIIFVCEHGAAKSIVAATYFNRLAEEQELEFRAIARGTNPDLALAETAVTGLYRDGLTPVAAVPQKLSADESQSAHRLVSFCELPSEYSEVSSIEHWDDVPPVSQDYGKARDVILENIHDLLQRLRSSS
jgi:protein-tyrosine-phosphatase